jgi:hypothetical protein
MVVAIRIRQAIADVPVILLSVRLVGSLMRS